MPSDVCIDNGTTSPVHQHVDGKWWCYDETWADEYGPYPTEEACQEALVKYAKYLDDGAEYPLDLGD